MVIGCKREQGGSEDGDGSGLRGQGEMGVEERLGLTGLWKKKRQGERSRREEEGGERNTRGRGLF